MYYKIWSPSLLCLIKAERLPRCNTASLPLSTLTIYLCRARPQFRLLTPTMYRSRMASTRQTHSMDCSSSNDNLRAAGIQPEDSLELELGASASRVDNKTGDCSGSGQSVQHRGQGRKSQSLRWDQWIKENVLERREEIWLTHSIQILISNVVNLLICKENCFLLHID